MRVTTTYQVVKLPVSKSFKACTVCGRPGKRQRIFRQTLNPYNKNAAGQPKITSEIWEELKTEAAAWQPDTHAGCES